MKDIGQIYTSGLWQVKKGKEKEFIDAWQQFAAWTSTTQAGAGGGRLLQDLGQTERFLSIGPWKNEKSIAAWRSTPEFAAFVQKTKELCDDFHPHTFKVVAHSSTEG